MCVNTRLVRNKWTRKLVRVSCGKCKACQQEKAIARSNRIRNHSRNGYIALFVTLTYSPLFIPYILRSDLENDIEVPIYRDASVRYYKGKVSVDTHRVLLDKVYITEKVSFASIPAPVKSPRDYIGVIYYRDVQNFMKRLRINLLRDFNYEDQISYYSCAEYGSCSKRPHMHLLIFIRPDDEEKVRSAIVKSWPFADPVRTERFIEVAKNAASYVASYVNSHFTSDSVLAYPAFKQVHSYSKDFGCGQKFFSLAEVVEKIRRRDLRYSRQQVINGVPQFIDVPIPKYVVNRYFPKFKGYSLLTDDEIRKLLLVPQQLCSCINGKGSLIKFGVPQPCGTYVFNGSRFLVTRQSDDVREWTVLLSNIFSRFHRELGWSLERFECEYSDLYISVWNQLKSDSLKHSYDDIISVQDFKSFYENISDLDFGLVHSDLKFDDTFERNPNNRSDVVFRTSLHESLYYKMDKSRKVVNYAMSHSGDFV